MSTTADRLARIIATTPQRLVDIAEDDASQPPAPGHWSKKQILGHLIDSASNNHQRFVRAQLASSYDGPTYQQESWVSTQGYAAESWPDLVNLWLLYNRHSIRPRPGSCRRRCRCRAPSGAARRYRFRK